MMPPWQDPFPDASGTHQPIHPALDHRGAAGWQNGACCDGRFVLRRETWPAGEAVMPPGLPSVDAVEWMPVRGLIPWPQRYDMCFTEGAFELWSPEGRLLTSLRQLVYFKG